MSLSWLLRDNAGDGFTRPLIFKNKNSPGANDTGGKGHKHLSLINYFYYTICKDRNMTIKELLERDFNGNVSAFAKYYDISRQTAYNLLDSKTKPQLKLRARLKRKGVHFD